VEGAGNGAPGGERDIPSLSQTSPAFHVNAPVGAGHEGIGAAFKLDVTGAGAAYAQTLNAHGIRGGVIAVRDAEINGSTLLSRCPLVSELMSQMFMLQSIADRDADYIPVVVGLEILVDGVERCARLDATGQGYGELAARRLRRIGVLNCPRAAEQVAARSTVVEVLQTNRAACILNAAVALLPQL